MKKRRPKSESMQKTEQDRPFLEILTFGQKSTQKVKVNWSKVKANSQSAHGSDPGRVGPGQRRGADETTLLTWLMTCL